VSGVPGWYKVRKEWGNSKKRGAGGEREDRVERGMTVRARAGGQRGERGTAEKAEPGESGEREDRERVADRKRPGHFAAAGSLYV